MYLSEELPRVGAIELYACWDGDQVLVFLHLIVLIVSINGHPIRTSDVVPGALPEALHRYSSHH